LIALASVIHVTHAPIDIISHTEADLTKRFGKKRRYIDKISEF
jgi:hypothetical protein